MSRKKNKSVSDTTNLYRGRVNPKGSNSLESDELADFFSYSRIGLHDLAFSVFEGKEIDINTVLPVIEKFLIHYIEQNPETKKNIGFLEDRFIEAVEQAKNKKYGAMLANLFLVWAIINNPTALRKLKKELRKGQSKGGMASHWKRHSKVIEKHLKLYRDRKYKNKSKAIEAIESETNVSGLSINTFNYWWSKYKEGRPLFLSEAANQN
jgi:hypothetical protein